MRAIKNFKLTNNISFYEYMEGTLPSKAIKWNWETFDKMSESEKESFIDRAKKIAQEVQKERDFLNDNYRNENNRQEFTIIVSCGFRCLEWELYKGRSGKGQHPIAAIDFKIGSISIELSAKMIKVIYDRRYKTWMGGFAIKESTFEKGKMINSGFVHIDNRTPNREGKQRGYGARWTYK